MVLNVEDINMVASLLASLKLVHHCKLCVDWGQLVPLMFTWTAIKRYIVIDMRISQA